MRVVRDIQVSDENILLWNLLIVPENPPYNKGKCIGLAHFLSN